MNKLEADFRRSNSEYFKNAVQQTKTTLDTNGSSRARTQISRTTLSRHSGQLGQQSQRETEQDETKSVQHPAKSERECSGFE